MRTWRRSRKLLLLIAFTAFVVVKARAPSPHHTVPSFAKVVKGLTKNGQSALTKSIPALNVYRGTQEECSKYRLPISTEVKNNHNHQDINPDVDESDEESPNTHIPSKHDAINADNVRIIRRRRLKMLPDIMIPPLDPNAIVEVKQKIMKRRLKIPKVPKVPKIPISDPESTGIYYGITKSTFEKASKPEDSKPRSVQQSMQDALEELRTMRQEMEKMRHEMETMKKKIVDEGDLEDPEAEQKVAQAHRRKQKEYDKIAAEVERWAEKLIYEETEADGWTEVACNKMMRQKLNASGRTKAYIKWMKDSRGSLANQEDNTEYPCIKVVTTIDAPIDTVCAYLSQESAFPEYNDVVTEYKDIEEITAHSKICWSQSPQILFLKPRDFVTFCHHRWRRDGTQVFVNQATEHPDYPGRKEEGQGKACRAYAIRGANFISRCRDDPEKTDIAIIAHADPGGNLPQWAARTAVNALAPVEPFKLFHKINMNVQRSIPQLREKMAQMEMVSLPGGRSPQPAGMAQLGYACFWPNGGGLQEGGYKAPKSNFTEENSNSLDDGGLKESSNDEEPVVETPVAADNDQSASPATTEEQDQTTKPSSVDASDDLMSTTSKDVSSIDQSTSSLADNNSLEEETPSLSGPTQQIAQETETTNKDPKKEMVVVDKDSSVNKKQEQEEEISPSKRRNRILGGRK